MPPYVGQMVQYRQRPGAVRQGQLDLAAIVTRVRSDGSVDLRIYVPDMHDPLIQQAVPRMSQEITGHCWHVPDASADAMRAQIEQLTADVLAAHERIDALEGGSKKQDAQLKLQKAKATA